MKKLFDFSVVLCQQVWRYILAMWRVSLDREMLQKDSYVPRKSLNMSTKELRRLSNVRSLWACQCHPYIESLPIL